ncbi:hypothetical protein PF005_g15877 [Phytophthora fragariae]|uniref:Uncharacterized protein n=1 Tax=Phytophthora fragariae TaxID=53985 RepID=A0A6A3JWM7_9STRA|nr:hypothetical protein PF003_g3440 [Phytophthora fragariae]KAE8938355.1 hypothetical protein PF009_g11762 [Phytophthora fragariae]KAE8999359.1 hypothetical protein PF011_g14660 [Phytophthora fragariae]KAE9098396.1 hypothetical protein PF010_g15577 [Phytophthora fragariae]KAE9111693.1 hypothetical protein PF007_g11382 [Phytophthora fragariae]
MHVRFDDCDDETLLQEILTANPFQVNHGTKTAARDEVAVPLGLDVVARRCRERCTLLVSHFKAKMDKNAAASGIDKYHTERDDLLANVFENSEFIRDEKKQANETKEQDAKRADTMRDDTMEGMGKKKSKHNSFKELLGHAKERVEFARPVEL